jgi:hypothetical protein
VHPWPSRPNRSESDAVIGQRRRRSSRSSPSMVPARSMLSSAMASARLETRQRGASCRKSSLRSRLSVKFSVDDQGAYLSCSGAGVMRVRLRFHSWKSGFSPQA